jgi:hypothetical protein
MTQMVIPFKCGTFHVQASRQKRTMNNHKMTDADEAEG